MDSDCEPSHRAGSALPNPLEPSDATNQIPEPAANELVALGVVDGEHPRRLQADQVLYDQLSEQGFCGPEWNQFVVMLVEYGVAVMTAWVTTGQIAAKCRKLKIALPAPSWVEAHRWPRDDVDELVIETVARAVVNFRDRVLVRNVWSAQAGATLKTFFIGRCLLEFRDVYRGWLREREPGVAYVDPTVLLDVESTEPDLADGVVLRDRITDVLSQGDAQDRRIARLRGWGFSNAEIAELEHVSEKAIEAKQYRYRRRLRKQGDQGAKGGTSGRADHN